MWPSTLAGSDASPTRTVPPLFGAAAGAVAALVAPAALAAPPAVAGVAAADVGGACGDAPGVHAAINSALPDSANTFNADRREIVACMRGSSPCVLCRGSRRQLARGGIRHDCTVEEMRIHPAVQFHRVAERQIAELLFVDQLVLHQLPRLFEHF